MDEFEDIIEQYRRELVDFSKQTDTSLSGIGYEREQTFSGTDVSDPPDPDERDMTDPPQSAEDDDESADSADDETIIQQRAPVIEVTSGDPIRNPNKEKFDTYEEFLQNNPQQGTLKVQVYASDQSYPIDNARVTVLLELKNGAREMFSGLTNTDGIIDSIPLPAPDAAKSQNPSNSEFLPYATYTTIIERPGYVNAKYLNVPVFSGVESIQGVEMIPLVSGGGNPKPMDMYTEDQFQRLEGD